MAVGSSELKKIAAAPHVKKLIRLTERDLVYITPERHQAIVQTFCVPDDIDPRDK